MNEELPNEFSHLENEAGRIAYLISGYIRESLTNAEHRELDNWVTASMDNQKLFENLTDPEILKKWMKEKIVYQDNVTEHFNASISRDSTVPKVLHLLESTGSIHFKIEEKTITVMK